MFLFFFLSFSLYVERRKQVGYERMNKRRKKKVLNGKNQV